MLDYIALYIALLVLYVRTMHPWEDGLAGYATWREEVQAKKHTTPKVGNTIVLKLQYVS